MNTLRTGFIAGLFVLATGWQASAGAVTVLESGDAGESLATAQLISEPDYDAISGTADTTSDADLYGLYLAGGTTYTFTVTSIGGDTGLLDSGLFLFNAAGQGLLYNDDQTTIDPLSQLVFTPSTSGLYYLGIASGAYNPVSASGFIFPYNSLSTTGQQTPSNTGALTGFALPTGETSNPLGDVAFGTYTVTISPAVPEPATLPGLAAFGVLGLAALRLRTH